ncbi:hypothetical protein C1646_704759 [Rhizophagus diaphanus]|nr:hypothetical protein C1646_704759 [Rhizophagus diaphanus] [Rhizophagus sp. MUCL 43196]
MAHFQFVFYIFCIIWNESYLSKYLVIQLIWYANPDIRRLGVRLCSYLNFTLFTFNKVRSGFILTFYFFIIMT